jgi:hypothetical protein
MDMRIISIILWPRDDSKKYKRINFKIDKINVITGLSQKGKSALIPIIDYCLGSGKCTIPVGIIREKVEWFGLLLQLEKSQIHIARISPNEHTDTSELYMDEAETIEIVDHPHKTCNLDAVKNRLNELAGLTTLDFKNENISSIAKFRPSFRDMAAFGFQPQHIIANPYTLYYKADTWEHREKLKTIFPFVLGSITNETLALKNELNNLEKIFEKKKEEISNKKEASNVWLSDIKTSYLLAREFGLINNGTDPQEDWDITKYIQYLKQVPKSSEINLPKIDNGSTERAVKQSNLLKIFRLNNIFRSIKLAQVP